MPRKTNDEKLEEAIQEAKTHTEAQGNVQEERNGPQRPRISIRPLSLEERADAQELKTRLNIAPTESLSMEIKTALTRYEATVQRLEAELKMRTFIMPFCGMPNAQLQGIQERFNDIAQYDSLNGPWGWDTEDNGWLVVTVPNTANIDIADMEDCTKEDLALAKFIGASRTDLPVLLEAVSSLTGIQRVLIKGLEGAATAIGLSEITRNHWACVEGNGLLDFATAQEAVRLITEAREEEAHNDADNRDKRTIPDTAW